MRLGAGWLLVALVAGACGPTTTAAPRAGGESVTVLVGGRVQVGPEASAIADGVVVISNGLITSVGRRADVRVPAGATVIDCAGGTTDEYVYMQQAGLSYAQILASLTVAPAARFGAAARAGRLAPGLIADIVVLDGDPAQDIRALARVRATLRSGRVIYRSAS